MGGTRWYYDGYETLDELYKAAVTANLESYKHEDNVDEKLADTTETKTTEQEKKQEDSKKEDSGSENGMIFPDSSEVELASEDIKNCQMKICDMPLMKYMQDMDTYSRMISYAPIMSSMTGTKRR